MSNPEGMFLDPPTNFRRIGTHLGSGACGVVHEVVDMRKKSANNPGKFNDEPIRCAVKLTPFTASSTALTPKKKKKTQAERNADLLYHEYLLYRNVLNSLRGSVIPLVPMTTTGIGEIPGAIFYSIIFCMSWLLNFTSLFKGFRYIIMELMKQPLFSCLP